jgi:hypothetical protein
VTARPRNRRAAGVVAAAAAIALAVITAALMAPEVAGAAPGADPLRALGGDSPLCAHDVGGAARRACERAGAVEHAYPLDRYRFDWHIDTGVTKVENNLNATVQWLVAIVWTLLLYLAKAVLLAFQWAFSLDLVGVAMRPAARALGQLHTTTLGTPWFSAAIALLGLWGVWNGLMRRRTIQTAAGLASAVLMMAAALAVINRPAETIGAASKTVNEVKLGVLAGATQGTVSSPPRSLADASRHAFDTIILRPWCAIQFGDVHWCLSRAPGDPLTRAERWLRFDVGSRQRDAEYRILADPDYQPGEESTLGIDELDADDEEIAGQLAGYRVSDGDRNKVAMQEKDNTLLRAGLVALIAVGIAGWVALIGYLSVQSLLQGMLTLVLMLGAPAMLLAPAFGDRGRATFAAWGTRLVASVVSGVIYALLLAIVITLATVIGELDASFSWMAGWLVQLIFFWGVFFKRQELLAWLSGGTHQSAGRARISELYHAKRLAESAAAPAISAAGAVAGLPLVAAAARSQLADRGAARTQAIQATSRNELHARARERLQHRYHDAHTRLTAHDDAQRKLPEMRRRQERLEHERDQGSTAPERRQAIAAEIAALSGQRKALETRLIARAEEGILRTFIETADRNEVESGQKFTERQLDLQLDEMRTELAASDDDADTRHGWRATRYRPGVPDTELAKLTPGQRADLQRSIDADIAHDRALLAALPADPSITPSRGAQRAAAKALDRRIVAARTGAYRREERECNAPPRHPHSSRPPRSR